MGSRGEDCPLKKSCRPNRGARPCSADRGS